MKRLTNDAAALLKTSLSMSTTSRSSIIESLAQTEKVLCENISPELRSLYELRFTKLVNALNKSLKNCSGLNS